MLRFGLLRKSLQDFPSYHRTAQSTSFVGHPFKSVHYRDFPPADCQPSTIGEGFFYCSLTSHTDAISFSCPQTKSVTFLSKCFQSRPWSSLMFPTMSFTSCLSPLDLSRISLNLTFRVMPFASCLIQLVSLALCNNWMPSTTKWTSCTSLLSFLILFFKCPHLRLVPLKLATLLLSVSLMFLTTCWLNFHGSCTSWPEPSVLLTYYFHLPVYFLISRFNTIPSSFLPAPLLTKEPVPSSSGLKRMKKRSLLRRRRGLSLIYRVAKLAFLVLALRLRSPAGRLL